MGNVQPEGASQDHQSAPNLKVPDSACEQREYEQPTGQVPGRSGGTGGKRYRVPWAMNKGKRVTRELDASLQPKHREPPLGTKGPPGPSVTSTNTDTASSTEPPGNPPQQPEPPLPTDQTSVRDHEPGERDEAGGETQHETRPTQPLPGLPPVKAPAKSQRPDNKMHPGVSGSASQTPQDFSASGQSLRHQGAISGAFNPLPSLPVTAKAAPTQTDPILPVFSAASPVWPPGAQNRESRNFLMQKEFRFPAPPSTFQSVKTTEPSNTGPEGPRAPAAYTSTTHGLKRNAQSTHTQWLMDARRSLPEKLGAVGDVQNVLRAPRRSSSEADARVQKKQLLPPGVEQICRLPPDVYAIEELEVTLTLEEESRSSSNSTGAPEHPTFSVEKPKFHWITPPESPSHYFQFKGSRETANSRRASGPLDTSTEDSMEQEQGDHQPPSRGSLKGFTTKDLLPILPPGGSAASPQQADVKTCLANTFAWPMEISDTERHAWADSIKPDEGLLKVPRVEGKQEGRTGSARAHHTKAGSKPNRKKSKRRPTRGPQRNTKCPKVISQNTPPCSQPPAQGQPPGAQGQPPGAQGQPPGAQGQPPGAQGQQPGAQGQPPGAQGQPPGAQGQPPGAQGQPPGAQGQPPGAQGQPPGAQGQQPGAQGQPPGAQGQPPGAQGQPPGAQGQPPGAQGQQPGAQGQPPGAQGQPPGAQGQPPGAQGQPPGAQGQPPGAQGQPPGAQGQPPGAQGNPDKPFCGEVASSDLPPRGGTDPGEEKPRRRWADFLVDRVCTARSRCKHRPLKLPPNVTSWFSVSQNRLAEPTWMTTLEVAAMLALGTKPLLDQHERNRKE